MKESIPHLDIELLPNGNIRLENESMGDSYAVDLHPMHLRFIAEKLGLVREMSASEADAGPTAPPTLAEMARDLNRLKRNLLRVRGYAVYLQEEFRTGADWKHADLTHEMNRINCLVDLLDMAVDDFDGDLEATDAGPVSAARAEQPHGEIQSQKRSTEGSDRAAHQVELPV